MVDLLHLRQEKKKKLTALKISLNGNKSHFIPPKRGKIHQQILLLCMIEKFAFHMLKHRCRFGKIPAILSWFMANNSVILRSEMMCKMRFRQKDLRLNHKFGRYFRSNEDHVQQFWMFFFDKSMKNCLCCSVVLAFHLQLQLRHVLDHILEHQHNLFLKLRSSIQNSSIFT